MTNSILLQNRARNYETPPPKTPPINDAPESYSNATNGPLQIDRPSLDTIIRPPKGVIQNSFHNPSVCASHNYNIVEDLAQAPCAMSTLEVLQNFPSQRQTLLSTFGSFDLDTFGLITFNTENVVPRLSHQLVFQIPVSVKGKKFH